MRTPTIALMTAAAALALCCAACGKKESSATGSPATGSSAASRPATTASSNPYSVPTLSDEKLTKFLESMKEDKNPLEVIFKQGGGMRSFADMKARQAEYDAFARKYGFKDATEYIDVWGRVMVGGMQLASRKMMAGLNETYQKQITQAEEALKKPGLSAEEKKMYEDQIDSAKRSLADSSKPETSGLNAADLALVEKYQAQIDAASKKYKAR